MNNIVLIAAIGENNELGKNNDLIWHLPNDLKFFRETTIGHPIIMGYKTFLSLPKLLPNRKHIVLSSQKRIVPEEVSLFNDFNDLITCINNYSEEVFVIGGASLYEQFIALADEIILTEIMARDNEADVYFPNFNKEDWCKSLIKSNEDNGIKYNHVMYKKIKN